MKKLMVSLLLMIGSCTGVFAQTTNFVINLSHINEDFYDFNGAVENQSFSYSDSGVSVDITMDMSLVQESGKLLADGAFSASASYGGYDVYFDANIVAKGTLSDSPAGLNAKMAVTMRGTASVSGYDVSVPFSASITENVIMNGSGSLDGTMKGSLRAAGVSAPFSETISWDAPAGYGIGETVLNVPIGGGTATINLPSGEVVSFAVTSRYNPKTSQYTISLSGVKDDAFSCGSTLSLAVVSNQVKTVSGTVLGQKAKYDAAVMKYDGIYQGTYSGRGVAGTWGMSANNGVIEGSFVESGSSYDVSGRLESTGAFVFSTTSGAQGTGRISPKGVITGRFTNPSEKISGQLTGSRK